jgi:hypothetical protein
MCAHTVTRTKPRYTLRTRKTRSHLHTHHDRTHSRSTHARSSGASAGCGVDGGTPLARAQIERCAHTATSHARSTHPTSAHATEVTPHSKPPSPHTTVPCVPLVAGEKSSAPCFHTHTHTPRHSAPTPPDPPPPTSSSSLRPASHPPAATWPTPCPGPSPLTFPHRPARATLCCPSGTTRGGVEGASTAHTQAQAVGRALRSRDPQIHPPPHPFRPPPPPL